MGKIIAFPWFFIAFAVESFLCQNLNVHSSIFCKGTKEG